MASNNKNRNTMDRQTDTVSEIKREQTSSSKNIQDIPRRFNASSTAFQVLDGIDLSDKYALITGSNSGIGYETARSLAKHGSNILFANRNKESTQQAIDAISKEFNIAEGKLKAIHLDLASLKSVKECALSVKSLFSDHLDILILNAGVFGQSFTESEDGFELTFQANHLGHLYLALLLQPMLKKNSRVVLVSSESHRKANLKSPVTAGSLSVTKEQYDTKTAYYNSKLCNNITAKVLSEEWKHEDIWVNSLHPGSKVYTNLTKSWWVYRAAFCVARPFTKSLQQAAATTAYVASSSDLEGITGLYFNDCFVCQESALARDKVIADEVLSVSLKMIQDRVGNALIEKYVDKYVKK